MNLAENIQRIKEMMNLNTTVLNEGDLKTWVKRRISDDNLEKLLRDKELDFPTLCDDFDHDYEYAGAVVVGMIDNLLDEYHSNPWDEEGSSDVKDYLLKVIRELYWEYLLSTYKITCIENR